jgi:N-acyl-L-homoserine lactone synthetase
MGTEPVRALKSDQQNAFGFADATRLLFSEVHRFAIDHRIERYVTVTTLAVERILRHAGIACERFSTPKRLGKDLAVAVRIWPADFGRAGESVSEKALASVAANSASASIDESPRYSVVA